MVSDRLRSSLLHEVGTFLSVVNIRFDGAGAVAYALGAYSSVGRATDF